MFKHFNAAFQNAMRPTFEQAIDKRMTKFKGNHIIKHYMKQKPIQRGFKYWCHNDVKTGYLYQFDDKYFGKTVSLDLELSGSVVMELIESLQGTYCRIIFENFYFSSQVVNRLMKERKIYFCGTVRAQAGSSERHEINKRPKKGRN